MLRPCIHCGEKLVLGENWTEGSKRHRMYMCAPCNSEKGSLWWHQHKRPDQLYGKPQNAEHIAARVASTRAAIQAKPVSCAQCGIDFIRTTAAQRYCSGQCWNKKARLKKPLKPRFRISAQHYAAILESQQSKCAICGCAHKGNGRRDSLAVDHCHASGTVRGLLCHRCNTANGLLKDNITILEAARVYLARFN